MYSILRYIIGEEIRCFFFVVVCDGSSYCIYTGYNSCLRLRTNTVLPSLNNTFSMT